MTHRLGITIWVVFPLAKMTLNAKPLGPRLFRNREDAVRYQDETNHLISIVYGHNATDHFVQLCEEDL